MKYVEWRNPDCFESSFIIVRIRRLDCFDAKTFFICKSDTMLVRWTGVGSGGNSLRELLFFRHSMTQLGAQCCRWARKNQSLPIRAAPTQSTPTRLRLYGASPLFSIVLFLLIDLIVFDCFPKFMFDHSELWKCYVKFPENVGWNNTKSFETVAADVQLCLINVLSHELPSGYRLRRRLISLLVIESLAVFSVRLFF